MCYLIRHFLKNIENMTIVIHKCDKGYGVQYSKILTLVIKLFK